MKNKTTTYKWAYLPFVFTSAAILATQATAGPSGSQRYQDAKQVSSINHEYVGGDHSIGIGVDDEGNIDAQFDAAVSRSDEHRTGVGIWAGYDLTGDSKGVLGRGGEVNHAWVSKDASGRVTHVNKTFVAYDRNEAGHDKATVGYGQENENLFWDGRVSKGLSGGKDKRTVGGSVVTDRAYDWGVGATVGKFLPDANARIRAGIDHEWSNKVGSNEKDARNTTLSAGIEKFFQGTGHSLSLDVAGSKNSGGSRPAGHDDTDVTGRLGYKYDFGGASIYQPDRRYRRVRVEVPGKSVAAYKTVPVYAKKTVRTPYKQLVKSTMELEGQTFFKLNSSKLIPSAQTRLKQIAAQIRKTGYKGSIRITGNTCGLGNVRYDQILSEKRAKEVRNFLIKNGFNPNHLIARGLGKGHPKYARTADQDFKNRRVDIEYVSEKQAYKTGYKTEQKSVQTGTRKVQLAGAPGAPRVIWKTEAIPTSPAWIQRALNNNIKHDRNVNTYTTTYGNDVNAANDTATTNEGEAVTIDVLANDDSDATLTGVLTQPANGSVSIVNDQIVYIPNAGFTGTDTFTYQVTDSDGNIATATVTITVIAVSTAPDAVNDSESTDFNAPVSIDVLGNDTDPENDTLTVTSFTQGTNGTVTEGANGELVYTPNDGFSGPDSFTYTISDGNGGTDTATVNVTVGDAPNKPPVANDDAVSTMCSAITIAVLGNDTDPDGDSLSVVSVDADSLMYGTVMQSGNQIIYTPSNTCGKGNTGVDNFSYTISDGNGNTDSANVEVTVKGIKDGGNTQANADDALIDAGETITLNVLANDTGNGLKIIAVDNPVNGSVTYTDSTVTYTPDAGFTGTDTFYYDIVDKNGYNDSAMIIIDVLKGCVKGYKCN